MGGFVDDVVSVGSFGAIDTDFAGEGAARAAGQSSAVQQAAVNRAIQAQKRAGRVSSNILKGAEGKALTAIGQSAQNQQGFFQPFTGLGERGVEESGFLADPQAQFDFLQNNPLFQLALDNANQQTNQRAASGGRLSAGDTLQGLSNNVLLSASPLIDRQRQDINSLLGFGTNIASQQAGIEGARGINRANTLQDFAAARTNVVQNRGSNISNLRTDAGAAEAAGIVGAQNAETAGTQQLIDIAATLGGAAIGAG